jgi:AIPR protein
LTDRANEQVVLEKVLDQKRQEVAPQLDPDSYFEVFACEQVLKSFDLSYEEIEQGIVGGGNDGGIDALFVFVNGQFIREDTDFDDLPRKDVVVDVRILQAKNQETFKEAPVDKLATTLRELLNLDADYPSLTDRYSRDVLDAADRIRQAYLALASAYPRLVVRITYASRGLLPDPKIEARAGQAIEAVRDRFSKAEATFEFLGAPRLLELAGTVSPSSYGLQVAETPLSTGDVGFIGLVRLAEYARFVSDESGELKKAMFDANVRDYQGSVEVNKRIHETLQSSEPDDFWWLNNGITIVATRASLAGRIITIESPQVVNGLQTSTEIHEYFRGRRDDSDDRHVLVRIVVPVGDESRDRIIRATNDQTPVPSWALRATDPLQRHIEEYFRASDFYYDRRKNFYKNQGVQAHKIISIPYLGQAMMAIALGEPNNARARPSSLIKSDDDYTRVFNPEYPIDVYLRVVRWMRRVDEFLTAKGLPSAQRNNLKYHLAYFAVAARLGRDPEPPMLSGVDLNLEDLYLERCAGIVDDAISRLADAESRTQDQVVKGAQIVPELRRQLTQVWSGGLALD